MKTLILIRHVDSPGGLPDPDITEKGKSQAEEIKDFLKSKSISPDLIFTSLFKRTIQTAEIINSNNVKMLPSISFNEYYVRPEKIDVETTTMGTTRAISKIYSVFDLFDTIMIVGHSSINKTIFQSFLNLDYEETKEFFNGYGEVRIIRYDWKVGDTNWRLIGSFIPK